MLAGASLGVLIYFIHHVSDSIQAPNVIATVSDDLKAAVDEYAARTRRFGARDLM